MEINPELAFKNVFAQCGAGRPLGGAVVTNSGKILYQENFDEEEIISELIHLFPLLRVGDFLSTGNFLILRVSTGISIILKFVNEQKVALAQLSLVGRFTAFAGWFDSLDEDEYNINSLNLQYPEARKICDILGCDSNTAIGRILELIVQRVEATREDLARELGMDEQTLEDTLKQLVGSRIIELRDGKFRIHTRLITITLMQPTIP
ncbi:MAG: winged helix-turn-helix domain-containing protein [Candidatus Freyarchaeota archaeon]